MNDLIGLGSRKLSTVKEQEDHFFDMKMETNSE
jgi:hypothetical protein